MILLALLAVLGQWLAPIPGAHVEREFSLPRQVWAAGHRGVDFAAAVGTAVQAIGPGSVVFAGSVAGRPAISIWHPQLGLRSTYEPVRAQVQVGQVVAAGEVIGSIADSGAHCLANCLHLGLRGSDRGDYRDPLTLLRPGYAVLKPLSG